MKSRKSRHRHQRATSLGDALSEVISPLAKQRRKPIDRVRLAWPTVCGIELARCTTPIAVNGTALRIEALDAHWASVLATLEEAILAEVQALVPKVEALQIELSTQSDGAGSGKGRNPCIAWTRWPQTSTDVLTTFYRHGTALPVRKPTWVLTMRRIKDTVGIRFVGLALLSLMLHPDGWLKQAHSETKGQGSPFIHYATADRATFFVGTILESSATADGQFLHRVRVEASAQPRRDREISIIGGRLPEAGTFLLP